MILFLAAIPAVNFQRKLPIDQDNVPEQLLLGGNSYSEIDRFDNGHSAYSDSYCDSIVSDSRASTSSAIPLLEIILVAVTLNILKLAN